MGVGDPLHEELGLQGSGFRFSLLGVRGLEVLGFGDFRVPVFCEFLVVSAGVRGSSVVFGFLVSWKFGCRGFRVCSGFWGFRV